jgi:triacylglycerol lipase
MDDARKLERLAAQMRVQGLEPVVLSPQPSDGSVGIDLLARRLAAQIEAALGPECPFDYFGFSMGGLIGRYYLQKLGGAARIRRMVTLATPHQGSWSAYSVPKNPAIVQMRPGSEFLTALNADLTALDRVEFVALWTPFDLSVTPGTNAYLPGRPAQRLFSPFHGLLVYDPSVIDAVTGYFCVPAGPVTPPG